MPSYKDQFWFNIQPSTVYNGLCSPQIWRETLTKTQSETQESGFPVTYSHRLGKQQLELTETTEEKRIEFEDTGAINADYTFKIEPQGTGTKVEFDASYTVTYPLVQRLVGNVVRRYFERRFESMLEHLQRQIQTRHGTTESTATA